MAYVPWSAVPLPPIDPSIELVSATLDPVLEPLGFAAGQAAGSGAHAQVIFCRGTHGSGDGACVDLVVDLEKSAEWQITDLRYWGFPAERWHVNVRA